MSQNFGEAASRLAGLAAQALGWRPNEFWNATPSDLGLSLRTPEADADSITRTELNSLLENERHG